MSYCVEEDNGAGMAVSFVVQMLFSVTKEENVASEKIMQYGGNIEVRRASSPK